MRINSKKLILASVENTDYSLETKSHLNNADKLIADLRDTGKITEEEWLQISDAIGNLAACACSDGMSIGFDACKGAMLDMLT
ncbi:MAG: hypothetical protein ACOX7B_07990 [Christensenellales bacterium]|jgi:hypothetical protein